MLQQRGLGFCVFAAALTIAISGWVLLGTQSATGWSALKLTRFESVEQGNVHVRQAAWDFH